MTGNVEDEVAQSHSNVEVRSGYHLDFGRLVLEWRGPVNASVVDRDPHKIVIELSRRDPLSPKALVAHLPSRLQAGRFAITPGGARLELRLQPGTVAHVFQFSPDHLVIDLMTPKPALKPEALPDQAAPSWSVPDATPAHRICTKIAQKIETEEAVPPGLLQSMTLAETGRWDPAHKRPYAWPWTITSGGDTLHLPDRAQALALVDELQATGQTNIDVGCMQINLMWHGDAFASPIEAIEPQTNIRYGADFLKRLHRDIGSWSSATARYHSSSPARGNQYRAKVFRIWHEMRTEDESVVERAEEADVIP